MYCSGLYLDEGQCSTGVPYGIIKALDCVDHSLLLEK